MWVNVCLLMWQAQGNRAAAKHDERERSLGRVEPVGAAGDKPHLVVERLDAGVVDAKAECGQDAVAVGADRAGELDERLQTAAAGLDAPAVEQLGRLDGAQIAGEDLAQAFLEPVGAPGRPTLAAQRAQGCGLGVGQALGALGAAPTGRP
jgi:hypothetical protein